MLNALKEVGSEGAAEVTRAYPHQLSGGRGRESPFETYRLRVYEKLHLNSRADLFEYALATGLLTEQLVPR